ncbi:putative ribonuclease H-like domain-containing protein [Tanacetum coccineum]
MMEADFELAQRLQVEEQGEITIEERSSLFVELMNKRKKHFAKLRAEEKRRKPPTKAQKRNLMSTYLKNVGGYKYNQLKSKSYDAIQKLFDNEMKRVNTFIPMDSEVMKNKEGIEESSKRTEDELESDKSKKAESSEKKVEGSRKKSNDKHEEAKEDDEAEMKKHVEIVKEGHKGFYHLIRADGSSNRYASMIKMLQNIRIDQGLGSTSGIRAFALRNFDLEVMEFESAHSNTTAKLPILKLGEYEMWVIRIKQYFQGYGQEEGIDYDKVFAHVARIEAIRIFLAFTSYMGFIVYQIDVKRILECLMYVIIDEEVYVSQPLGFVDPKFPKKVYKVVKICMVYIKLLEPEEKQDCIFIRKDKYVASEILKKFDFDSVKTGSTPIETQKPLVKDEEAADVDVFQEQILTGNHKQEVVQFLARGTFLWKFARNKQSWLLLLQRQSMLLLPTINPVFHSKTKHIEIRHHYIRDAYGGKSGLVCAAQKYFMMEMMFGLGNKMLLGLVLETINVSMANLEFVDQHNMITCLEKTEGNSNFHEIVDFLASSLIHYALTVSPPIYTSYIEQFWNTASSQTVNDVKQINATDDSKAVVVIEALIKSSLLFNDADAVICLATNQKFNFSKLIFDGKLRNLDNTKKKFLMCPRFLMVFLNNQIELGEPFNDVYPTPAHNLKVFTNMSRKGLKFLGKITPLFPNMLTHAAEGEGSGEPTEPQPTPSPTQPSTGDQPPETSSSHATTQDSRDSLEGTNGNEGDQVQTPHDSPLSGGHTSDRAEGALNLQELSVLCTNLSNRVLALESIKDAQAAEISALKSRIKKLEKKCKPSISHHRAWLKSVKRLSMKKRFGKKESVSKQGRKKSKPESTLDDSTVFDDQDADHGMEYMETKEAVDEGRQSGETEEVKLTDDTEVVEDKSSV